MVYLFFFLENTAYMVIDEYQRRPDLERGGGAEVGYIYTFVTETEKTPLKSYY